MIPHPDLEVHPLTPERWDDLVALFTARGGPSGCWCVWWRVSAEEFRVAGVDGRRRAMQDLVGTGNVPGLLGYRDGQPVGWCSIGPRQDFGRILRSPKLRPLDDTPAWSIVCFFVPRQHRDAGVAAALLEAAVGHARSHGVELVEAYPVDPKGEQTQDSSAYTGVVSMFERAGFVEAGRRGGRPTYRLSLPAVPDSAPR